MTDLFKELSNLKIDRTPREDFPAIVKQIYESDQCTHEIDSKYLRFFSKLQVPVKKNTKINYKLLKVERIYQASFTITCFVSAKSIMISNAAIRDGQIKGFFKHLKVDPEKPVVFAPNPARYLPNTVVLITALTKFTHEKVPYSIRNDPGLAIALALIESIFEGFWTKYEQYLEDPDDGITVVDDICGFNENWSDLYIPGFVEPNMTESEKKFIAFIIILSMFKPMPKIDGALCARKKRYDVIRAIVGYLPVNQDDKFIDILTMQYLAKYFEELPKLKSLVLSCAASLVREDNRQPIHDYLLKILIQPEMTLFIIIDEFVSMPVKTKAHSHWNIVKEIHCFLYTKNELMKKFGNNYYFAKLLEPAATDINVAKWPHLGAVAMMSANIKYPKTKNLKILGLTYDIDFPELLMKEVKPNSNERVDCAARDSDLFLKALYGK